MKRPEEYKWCSLGYHVQTGNKDDLLCVDFGIQEWNEFASEEIVRKYREFVYETGAAEESEEKGVRSEELGKRGIDPKIVKKERKKNYKVNRVDRFRYRCRYFNDAGIIGSKSFVGEAPVKWEEILPSIFFFTVYLRLGIVCLYSFRSCVSRFQDFQFLRKNNF